MERGHVKKVENRQKACRNIFDTFRHFKLNSVHTRCIVKTSGFTRGVCEKIGDFIKFKSFLVEFLENRRS